MSMRTLPLLFINLGGEMLYILDQRLQAQNIPADKAKKVMNDIISTMFNKKFMEELLKPQEVYTNKALRTVFERLAHSSIMRLNHASMDKLYDLMIMAFKYQVLLCLRPRDLLLVSFNHLDTIKDFVRDVPSIFSQVDETHRQLIEIYGPLSGGEFQLIRQTLLLFFQDLHIRVSIFLKDKVQNSNGRFALPTVGPVPHGTEVPGLIRIFGPRVNEVKRTQFPAIGSYTSALREGSFDIFGDRVTTLGTNIYCVSRPVETQPSAKSKSSTQHSKVNAAPNPLAKEELNLLSRLMGHLEVQNPDHTSFRFRVNLFSTDEEEEEALLSRPEDLAYDILNIHAIQDQQTNEELARIMGEFPEEAEPSHYPSMRQAAEEIRTMEVTHSIRERTIAENSLVILLQGLQGQVTTVDLRDESTARGRVLNVDAFMNIRLEQVLYKDRRGQISRLADLFITGRNVRYVHIPDNVDIMDTIQAQLRIIGRVRNFGEKGGRKEYAKKKK
ncbi:hypothetical protein AAFF_G00355500 [Aldrovandia affinis]|uniref:Sm domain-containing protein n=1 Tax=Aldrovandia affinis TaxID=143900 RepID=A0AAD7R5L5_9TELE|nr:hypothetical protein AAFF_G00355500 [Aldrovandia affinis]